MKKMFPFLLVFGLMFFLSACGPSTEELLRYMSQTQTALAPTPTPTPEGYVEVPDVIGMTRKEAYELFDEIGLTPLTFWVLHDEYSYGQVTDCEPAVGESVPLGAEIVLDVVGEMMKGKASDGDDEGGGCGPEPQKNCGSAYETWCECTGGIYVEQTVIVWMIPECVPSCQ